VTESVGAAGPTLRAAARGDRGARATYEDACHVGTRVLAVADGVGGCPAGEVASRLAVDVVADWARPSDLTGMVTAANERVRGAAAADPRRSGMATTLDVAVLDPAVRGPGGPVVTGAHVGDSVAMLLHRRRHLVVLTRPHTVVAELTAADALTEEQAVGHPLRHTLTRAVGARPTVRVDRWCRPAAPGDRYLLGTDGLLDALGIAGTHRVLLDTTRLDPAGCADALVAAAVRAGAADNVTVVVADIATP